MRLLKLHLQAFGPFTDRPVDFGENGETLHVIYGPNEAGKSAMLRAISDVRYGIPDRTTDNFVHNHPDMRIGGVFLDRQGRQHSLMRRKGRGTTLTLHEFNGAAESDSRPVSAEVEALLTAGLSKQEYEAMFGLDHHRLREGGDALLRGEGEVGAALFEASSGVRSIPAILERLDQNARQLFMPGARGKNARINEALRLVDEHHATYRQALVRPAQWVDLNKQHETAVAEIVRLEQLLMDRRRQLDLIKELRAVAPLLVSLDEAKTLLAELSTVVLLPLTCAVDRVAAQTALANALAGARTAAATIERQNKAVSALQPDAAVLNVANAIERLDALAETIETLRQELTNSAADGQAASAELSMLAARIDGTATLETLLLTAPSPSAKAEIDQTLRAVERAEQAVEQHRHSLANLNAEPSETTSIAVSTEARLVLTSARDEIKRIDGTLKRLAVLPAEIAAAQRRVETALGEMGLEESSALLPIQPLLDAEIDTAVRQSAELKTRQEGLAARIEKINQALVSDGERRDALLAAGAVPTPDDVLAARKHREQGWSLIRRAYIDSQLDDKEVKIYAGDKALPHAYEEAVHTADELVDEVGRDAQRASQLQACLQGITRLQNDQALLSKQLVQLENESHDHRATWRTRLQAAHLPPIAPSELREWQARLTTARAAIETLNNKLDEKDQAQAIANEVANTLRAAILATGLATPACDAALRTLSSMADEIEQQVKQGERDLATAKGQRVEQQRQREQWQARERTLIEKWEQAQSGLQPILVRLRLPTTATVTVARARLSEFDTLLTAQEKNEAAELRKTKCREALATIERQADAVATALGEKPPTDLRLYIDQLSARLEIARQTQRDRIRAEQDVQSAVERQQEHEEAATQHERTLAALCVAASVNSDAQLPEAEERSRRKREAEAEIDRARDQLARASRRTVDELRALLQEQDLARLDLDEAHCNHEIETVNAQLPVARENEEATRRALEAINSTDTAAAAREAMERAAASVRAHIAPWVRSRLAHALLTEALKRFRERAQGPMLMMASTLFHRITGGEFERLLSDDTNTQPVLLAQRKDGSRITVDAMSEGTRDQLYLALRLAALRTQRTAGVDLPVILDDVLMTSDDSRARLVLQALAEFSTETQVIVFTHHEHLLDLARSVIPATTLSTVTL